MTIIVCGPRTRTCASKKPKNGFKWSRAGKNVVVLRTLRQMFVLYYYVVLGELVLNDVKNLTKISAPKRLFVDETRDDVITCLVGGECVA